MLNKYKKLLLIANILLAIIFILRFKHIGRFHHVNLQAVVVYVCSFGKYSVLAFILIYMFKPLLMVIPSSLLSIAGGIIFGPFWGLNLNMIGYFLSGTLAFFLSRWLGKPFVNKMFSGKSENLSNVIEKNGFKIIILLRLIPVLPFDLVSYTAGITSMSYSRFIIGSLIGVIPETLCYTFLGKGLRNPISFKLLIPLIIIIIFTLVGAGVIKRKYKIDIEK